MNYSRVAICSFLNKEGKFEGKNIGYNFTNNSQNGSTLCLFGKDIRKNRNMSIKLSTTLIFL